MRKLMVAWVAFFAVAALVRAQAPVFSGEFQVNVTPSVYPAYLFGPRVANLGPDSNFVVVWTAVGFDGSEFGVVGRIFDEDGTPLGGDFGINASTTGFQSVSEVDSNAAGNFVVTWTENVVGSDVGFEVRARRFDASGVPQGGDIVVNTYTTGSQGFPQVAVSSAGEFVVVWMSGPATGQVGQDGSDYGVFGRRYDASGNPLSAEFQVNEYTTGSQYQPRIAMNPGGDFIVAWSSPQDAQYQAIMARRYDNAGAPLGGEFRINTTEAGFQSIPDVALDSTGNAIVVWQSDGQDGSESGVYGQRLDPSGNKLGPEFNVNTYTTGHQGGARVVAPSGFTPGFDPGEFAVIWQSGGQDGSFGGVFAQHFFGTGRRNGLELPVNSTTTGDQKFPAIAAQPNGQFVAAWNEDNAGYRFMARLAGVPRAEVNFADVPHTPGLANGAADSNENGVLEVGEQVNYETSFRNWTNDSMSLTGSASNFRGPLGLTYDIPDSAADWGTIAGPGGNADCFQATGDCYQFSLTGTRPATQHVDAAFDETLSYNGFTRTAALHVGESFSDVPPDNLFYTFIENLFHNAVTGGCAGGGYCPLNNVTRAQMSVFLLKARWGAVFLPPPATGTAFPDVPASNPFARWIEELVREGITAGCGSGLYCPDNPVTREQMAVFLLKTLHGAAYDPPDCAGDFDDVPCPSQYADWIEDLNGHGITGGCAPDLYCPSNSVLRQQMAAFLVKTFGLQLY